MMKTPAQYDCVIIGGGPGGLVSALYLGRFRRRVLLVDAGEPRARWIPRIRNLVGYAKGLTGPELLKRLQEQVQQYPVEFLKGEAQVLRAKKGFEVLVGNSKIRSKKVILAIGIVDKQPAITEVPKLRKAGLLGYCPICDGYDHAEQRVALFVKDSRCIKKIKYISELCPKLTLVPVSDFKFSPAIEKLAKEKKIRIAVRPLAKLDMDSSQKVLKVYLRNLKKPLNFDFGYVVMGVHFNMKATERLRGLKRVRGGYIQTSSHQETSIPGLFAVGDCVNALAQVSVAIGQAALAATRIHHNLVFENR